MNKQISGSLKAFLQPQNKSNSSTMPSEQSHSSQSQSQRPALQNNHRSTSGSDSPFGSPHGRTNSKLQIHKHVVGGRGSHARVPSSKALHKSASSKVHISTEDSHVHVDLKKSSRNSSATSLKKNSSHVSLKRNRSHADVAKRPKSSQGQTKRPASVHFEIGQDQDQDQDEAWEEASQSASPALSRAVSSGKASANTSRPQSPSQPSTKAYPPTSTQAEERHAARNPSADAKAITERLLQRTPSYNTTKMSLATATPDTQHHSPSISPRKNQSSLPDNTPKIGSNVEVVSRFVGGSGTPSENSPFLQQNRRHDGPPRHTAKDEVKRAQSMGNLTRTDNNDEEEESALLPRSRKSSTTHTYVPPQHSRTQQKLWLQRASSNMEPQQMAPGILHPGSTLVGAAGYSGHDPRIKAQLEKTGLEYLVVRRYQDPVGKSLKRLSQLPGAEKIRRIPSQSAKSVKGDGNGIGRTGHGLSQSMSQSRLNNQTAGAGSSYEGQSGSQEDTGLAGRGEGDDGVGALLRSMWEKSYELSASAD